MAKTKQTPQKHKLAARKRTDGFVNMKKKISNIRGLSKVERLQKRRQDAKAKNCRKRILEYDSSTDSNPSPSKQEDSTVEIPCSASNEEFAHGFKDTAEFNNVIEVDNISLCGSVSEEDQKPIDPPKGQIPVPIIKPISPLALLYSYLFKSLKRQLQRLPPCYRSICSQLASLDQFSPSISSPSIPKGVFSTSIQLSITVL